MSARMSNRRLRKELRRGLSDRAKPGFGIGNCLPRLLLQSPPVAAEPDKGLAAPYTQLRLHHFSAAIPVVVLDAIFAADGASEIKDLVFVQFGAAVGTEEKKALVVLLHDVTSTSAKIIAQRRTGRQRKFQCAPIAGVNRKYSRFHLPGMLRVA